jgi:hypothetical protein
MYLRRDLPRRHFSPRALRGGFEANSPANLRSNCSAEEWRIDGEAPRDRHHSPTTVLAREKALERLNHTVTDRIGNNQRAIKFL